MCDLKFDSFRTIANKWGVSAVILGGPPTPPHFWDYQLWLLYLEGFKLASNLVRLRLQVCKGLFSFPSGGGSSSSLLLCIM